MAGSRGKRVLRPECKEKIVRKPVKMSDEETGKRIQTKAIHRQGVSTSFAKLTVLFIQVQGDSLLVIELDQNGKSNTPVKERKGYREGIMTHQRRSSTRIKGSKKREPGKSKIRQETKIFERPKKGEKSRVKTAPQNNSPF